MAHTISTRTLVDTESKAIVMVDGESDGGTNLSANVVWDSSTSNYALATITLAGAPTTNFCIGEIITSDSISMVVQDYTAAATTVTVYRCTSGTDATPLGWAAADTGPSTTEAIVGSVSGTSSTTTHGSTGISHVSKEVAVTRMNWSVGSGHTIKLYYAGGTATQDIAYLNGNGNLLPTNGFTPISMGTAAGNASNVLGNILALSLGSASGDTETLQIEIHKKVGYATPNYEKNGTLGYMAYQAGSF